MKFAASLFCLVVLAILPAVSAAREILVAAPASPSPLIAEFIEALGTALPDDAIRISRSTSPDLAGADAVITLGGAMLDWRLKQPSEILSIATYVNHSALPNDTLPSHQQILLATPKPERQLRLAKLLLPRIRRVGLLYSKHEQALKGEWEAAIESADIQAQATALPPGDSLVRALMSTLNQSDVLIGTDDPAIYNSDNLKTILLTSYSRNKVLIGPSAPFIEAGSLSTTYSTPQDMARSVAQLINRGQSVGGMSYPVYFSVLSNAQVARSLGLPIPDDVKLGRQLAELEQTP
jgi:hypothetical protein